MILQKTREHVPYPFDEVPPDEPLDEYAPLEFASWEDRPVVIARRRPEYTGGRARVSVPISISRLRRAIDILGERNVLPYTPSMVDMTPLAGVSDLKVYVRDHAWGSDRWIELIDDAIACGATEDELWSIIRGFDLTVSASLESFAAHVEDICLSGRASGRRIDPDSELEAEPAFEDQWERQRLAAAGWAALGVIGTAVGAYHGYKRTRGSVGWTLAWAIFGGVMPVIALPVAVAQGVGRPK